MVNAAGSPQKKRALRGPKALQGWHLWPDRECGHAVGRSAGERLGGTAETGKRGLPELT